VTGSHARAKPTEVLRQRVPLASLHEQQRVVNILEDHLSRLDVAEDNLQRASRRAASWKSASAFARLLGADSSNVASLRTAVTDDYSLPTLGDRDWARLGDLAEVVGGVTKDAKRDDPSMVDVPYLRVANVQRMALDLSTISTIRVPPAKAESLRLLPGDVLLNEGGDRDKLARGWVWQGQVENCIHQNHVYRARPNREQVLPEWLAWSANYLGGEWAARHGRQSVNLASISLSTIKRMPVPLPSTARQAELLGELAAVQEGAERVQRQVDAARTRSASFRRALLSAAFSGQLTGRASDSDRIEELADASHDPR